MRGSDWRWVAYIFCRIDGITSFTAPRSARRSAEICSSSRDKVKKLLAAVIVLAMRGGAPYIPNAVTTYTIASSASSPQASGLFAQTATNPAVLNITLGDTLFIVANECGDTNCESINGPVPTSFSVSAGSIGACVQLVGTTTAYLSALYTYECPITASGTNSNISANYGTNAFWSQVIVVDVNRSPSATLVDEGVGAATGNVGAQQNASVGPMTPTQSTNFVLAILSSGASGINNSPGIGFTTIQNPVEPNGNQGLLVEYEITNNTNPVTPTGTLSSTEDYRMVGSILY